jgi:hypothetical protein
VSAEGPPADKEKIREVISVVKNGKLMNKEDEIEIKVETSTWKSMYNFVGGIRILLPFTFVVAFFSQINFYREQIV